MINSINNLNKKYNQPSFKGNPIMTLPIKIQRQSYKYVNGKLKRTFDTLPCTFSEMTTADIPLVSQVREFWSKTIFGNAILSSFDIKQRFIQNTSDDFLTMLAENMGIKKMRFFMLEDTTATTPEARIKGLARIANNNDGGFSLQFLQSANDNPDSVCIKGVGTAMLYAVTRLAEKKGKTCITLNSTPESVKWYRKMGLKQDENLRCSLAEGDFAKAQKQMETRMGIERPAFIGKGKKS